MCDTLVARPRVTANGETLFAKNSDRERNEAQFLELNPAADHRDGGALQLTYIVVPQVRRTHACLLSRPFWMWGAEMGVNEHGVAIGNEAVHSVIPASRQRALTGMDLVRLGLERGKTAQASIEVMVDLLERHGQGGDCGHLNRFYYHNSFIVADAADAFVVETVGRWWAIERIERTRAISNALTIHNNYQAISPELQQHASDAGWLEPDGTLDFAFRLIDRPRDLVSQGLGRCARGNRLLEEGQGRIDARRMMSILRDHGENGASTDWSPENEPGRTICMHATVGLRRSQTVGSMVSQIGPAGSINWVTGGASPCLSIFKPVLFSSGLPDQKPFPTDRYDPATRWWKHERLHRLAIRDFATASHCVVEDRDALEWAFVERITDAIARDDGPAALRTAVDECWREADSVEDQWRDEIERTHRKSGVRGAYARSWGRLNAVAGLTV